MRNLLFFGINVLAVILEIHNHMAIGWVIANSFCAGISLEQFLAERK